MEKSLKLLAAVFLSLLVSCGKIAPEGSISAKDIPVEDFNAINLKGKFRVFFVNNAKNFVTVETYPNIASNLDIEVSDKTLSITENRATKGVDFYNVTIYSKLNPASITVSDSVEVNVSGGIKTDNFKIILKNNAKFIGAVTSRRAEVEMVNAGRANFTGFTGDAVMKVSDSAGIIAPYWELGNLNIDLKGGSYAEVNVKDSIKGNIRNASKFIYYNDPIRAFKIEKTATVQNKMLN